MRTIARASLVALALFGAAASLTHADTQPVLSYEPYAGVLTRYVDDRGLVDYKALAAHPESLRTFTEAAGRLTRATYAQWSRDDRLAFWLNVYNALTLQLIAGHYPITPPARRDLAYPANSIRHIPGAWTGVTFEVMGEAMTLDHIEHAIIRGEFHEPRVHVALVCAAVSCPPLRREPYRGEGLSAQLDDQARRFLARRENFLVDRDRRVVRISAIFDWFAADFVGQYEGREGDHLDAPQRAAIEFVSRYVDVADRAYLEERGYRVEYAHYDWTLNERTP